MADSDTTAPRQQEKPAVDAHEGLHTTVSDQTEQDVEAPEARGLDLDEIPAEYWRSFRFLGSATSIILLAVCLYIGFSLPVRLGHVVYLTNNSIGLTACCRRAVSKSSMPTLVSAARRVEIFAVKLTAG